MPQESNEGVSYLLALKHSTTGGAAAAPAQSDGLEAGHEKRRSPRYKCEGSAELREQASDVRTWATFTDVSMHGCYVEAASTYPVGTVVHVKLDANTFQVEATGNVRVTYPGLGMGIAFTEVSETDRARLKELLGTLSRPSVIMGPGISAPFFSGGLLRPMPLVADPMAAIQTLIDFFEHRHMLTREEFLAMLHKNQARTISR